MSKSSTPLRYPGGKGALSGFLNSTIRLNDIQKCIYVEPFAGGAGAAINLLLSGSVEKIILNDADVRIWAFWKAILSHTEDFLDLLSNTEISVEEWRRQREIYLSNSSTTALKRGFASFYLNRCNRSGILMNGGVIGGLSQEGKWKIDARFNKVDLAQRIERISAYAEQIEIHNNDALHFLRETVMKAPSRNPFLVNLDPPYYVKGSCLYLNQYTNEDHYDLAQFLRKIRNLKWLVTYDNVAEIRNLYHWANVREFNLHYSAHSSKKGNEVLIHDAQLQIPLEDLMLGSKRDVV